MKELYVAYFDYVATGEGNYVFMVLGHSAIHAERVFDKKVDEMFKGSAEVQQLEQIEPFMRAYIPEAVIKTMKKIPAGSGEWYGCLYYNFS